jgi:hypothetical protein
LAFQSSAKAEVVNANEARPAIRNLRFIMVHPSGLGLAGVHPRTMGFEEWGQSGRGSLAESRNV